MTWIDGESGAAGREPAATDDGLAQMARLARRLHTAGRGFILPGDLDWADRSAPRSGGVLRHGDFGPWNVVWRRGHAIGLIDWDMVHAGDPLDDVHDALEYLAPFRDDDTAVRWLGHRSAPDRIARITLFWRAYAGSADPVPVAELIDGVIARQRARRALVAHLAEEGVEPQATWVQNGYRAELDARIGWSCRFASTRDPRPATRVGSDGERRS